MKYIKPILLLTLLSIGGLYANQEAIQQNNLVLQDPIAGYIVQAMQDCVDFNEDVHAKLFGVRTAKRYFNNAIDNQSAWTKAIGLYHKYINELRQEYNDITRPELTLLPEISHDADLQTRLVIQANQAQFLFSRLLNEYIAHLGQVYEKKSGLFGLYTTSYYISSRNNRSIAITPNEYTLLLQTLDKAAQQKDWSQSVDLKVLVSQENGLILERTLNLNEIINAIKQVPLPIDYSTAATIGAGVVAAAAVCAGAYLAYQAYNTHTPTDVPTLEKDVIAIKNQVDALSAPSKNSTPPANKTKQPLPVATSSNHGPKTTIPFNRSNNVAMPAQSAEENYEIEYAPTNSTTKPTRRSGLQRYLEDIASNPDFDNPMAADSYVRPDKVDTYLGNIPIHVANDVINLPSDVANRAHITYKNINSGNYKPGQTAQQLMEKSVQVTEDYANGSVDPYLEDPSLQPFDSGDQALLNTTNALYVVKGLARAANDNIARKTAQSIDREMADFANYGKTRPTPPAPTPPAPSAQVVQVTPPAQRSIPEPAPAPQPMQLPSPKQAPAPSAQVTQIIPPAPRSIQTPTQAPTPPTITTQPTVDAAQTTQNALEANTSSIFTNLSNSMKSGYDKVKTAGQSMIDKARQATEEAGNKFLDKTGNKIAGETAQGVDQGITNFGNYGKNAGVSNFEQKATVQATKPARLGRHYEYLPEGYVQAS